MPLCLAKTNRKRFTAQSDKLRQLAEAAAGADWRRDQVDEGAPQQCGNACCSEGAYDDGDHNETTIAHDAGGNPTEIRGPYGQKTTLAFDGNGLISEITNPAGQAWSFTYTDSACASPKPIASDSQPKVTNCGNSEKQRRTAVRGVSG